MGSQFTDSKHAVAHIFNSAIAAAWEIGFLDELLKQQEVSIADYAEQHDLDLASLKGLASALATVHVVKRDANTVTAGAHLDEAYRYKSLFHWLTLGSGTLFARMQHVLRNENRTGSFYSRDSAAIAYACREANAEFFDPMFWKAMGEIDYQVHSVVDLGCGSGEKLMQILERYPGAKAIDIDITKPAVEFATAESVRRGLSHRLTFSQGDACALKHRDEFSEVDLLTSFLMGHDFWPRENCVATLKSLHTAFPNVRRFLLCDTARVLLDSPVKGDTSRSRYAVTEDDVPLFTLGFEFGHALMDTFIPTIEDWEGVLEEGGWRCKKSYTFPPSLSFCMDLEPIIQD
ncbi:S-adenosyl-L-methionine-dependent methyltransferase [Rhypophila sp. PSN 637]